MKAIKRYTPIVLVVLLLLAILGGCKGKGGGEASSVTDSSIPSSVSSQQKEPVSSASAQKPVSSQAAQTESGASSVEGGNEEPTSSSQQTGGQTSPSYIEGFEEKFANNPIDAAYQAGTGETTTEMVQAASKFAGIWEREADAAYCALMDASQGDSAKAAVQDDQEAWLAGKQGVLDKILSDAQAAGGSLARLNANIEVMNFYRGRAKELYEKLYQLQPDYTYVYTGEE